ncbi:Metallo dependent phosphatase like domain [Trypanosoma vivax]|nr:hypothetical protein TRVL_03250 [Trypanosoma vivax]KAH8611873.1 Metallo dependent phosphatase like domain [Trypanosoma vivax]
MNASRQLDDRYANVFVSYIRFVQQDVMWTVVYIIFLVWMYLFHAPFRFHSVWRTDWYAQVTKVLQIWIGVVVFFFHTGSWFFHPGQTTSNRYSGGEEDIFATIFFPIFSLTTLIILYIHKKKRDWGLGITYGANVVILLLNSLLISLFSTVHFGYCMQLQDIEHSTLLKSAVGILCPSSKQTLFPTLLLLSGINILFIVADYRYKKRHGYDPLRGILWGEHYELRKGNVHTIPAYGPTEDWRKLQPKPKRILGATRNRADMLTFRGKASFAATPEEVRSLSLIFPHNQPGMVPWFSTFIAGTALQSFLGASLNFLTFDQRVVEPHVFPKVFKLSFVSRLIKGGGCGDSLTLSESTVSTDNNKPLDRVTSDVWFDFIGDVGDGFNSTYEMARLMAQCVLVLPSNETTRTRVTGVQKRPSSRSKEKRRTVTPPIRQNTVAAPLVGSQHALVPHGSRRAAMDDYQPDKSHVLPRASFVVVGGDLAYPNPTDENYQTRLREPYHDALWYSSAVGELVRRRYKDLVSLSPENKDVANICMLSATRIASMSQKESFVGAGFSEEEVLRSVPLLFSVPGNHDWLDGLVTFKKYIIGESWLGGWLMPQRSSFFILQLPYNWFMLCADTGSTTDIDTTQRNYFFEFIEKNLNEASCVILVCHEPAWVYEAMNKKSTRPMQPQLNQVIEVLGTRLRLRLCGDVHHYSRHTPADALSEAPTLIVSGGGGAFLHGARSTPVISQGTEYIRSAAFPAHNDVTSILARLVGFRLINWKFDIIAGVMCFGLIISALPLSMEDSRLHQINDVFQLFTYIGIRTVELFIFTINEAITSFILSICVFFIFFLAGGEKKSASFRGVYALHWTILVVLVSTSVLSFVQATLAYMTQNGLLLSTDGRWQSMIEVNVRNGVDDALNRTVEWLGEEHVISHGIRNVQLIAYDSFMVNGGCVLLRSMDVIENLAYLSRHVSTNVTGTFSPATDRLHVTLYYLHVLLFFWLLATPVVSFVIGVFLFVSVHFFDFLYDAAYSSFQIEDYKQFVRFKLDGESRSLHGYVVARTRVPKAWKRDSNHVMEFTREESKHLPPHLRKWPSRWKPQDMLDSECSPEVLEHFVINPHRTSAQTSCN